MPIAPARFHSLRDKTVRAVDTAFAELVRIAFKKDGKNDPDRTDIELEAPLRTTSKVSPLGRASEWEGSVAASPATLHIDAATYDGPVIRKKDKVRALSRRGQPWFEVVYVDDRTHTRIIVHLSEA